MNSGKAVLGIVAGIAAGAALGILFAPEKGKETRRKISKKGMDLADAVNEKIDEKFEALLDALNCTMKKANVNDANESGKDKA